jgi:hypothetical protein
MATGVTLHVTPAHAFHADYLYRRFDQKGAPSRALVRYELGWTGILSRRVSASAAAATVDFRERNLETKIVGDGSIAVAVNDKVRLNAGGGRIVMDAYPSLHNQVTAPYAFGEVAFRFDTRAEAQVRYSRHTFSDEVTRDRADFQYMRTLRSDLNVKFRAGWRLSGMWHDRQTPDFWSPSQFHSSLAVGQLEGHITPWLDYSGEVAAGFQKERGSSIQHPLQVAGRFAIHPGVHWRSVIELGRSTSSVERSLPGQRVYSRWFFGASAEFRFQ